MIEVLEGTKVKEYEYECGVCGGVWRRWWYGWADAREYVRVRRVCPVGLHVVEGGLGRVVEVRRVRASEASSS